MTDLREAAQQALEALETVFMPHHPAVIALKAALAEEALQRLSDANQEIEAVLEQLKPVFYAPRRLSNEEVMAVIGPFRREWRGLKEWEINDGFDQLPTEDVCSWSFRKGVYFAETALKERNA
jgi:hypothetical protein